MLIILNYYYLSKNVLKCIQLILDVLLLNYINEYRFTL